MGRYAVLGATSWGVTLAWLLAERGHTVTVLTRDDAEAATVRALRGLARLPELMLAPGNPEFGAASTFHEPVDGIVVATPAQSLRATVAGTALPRSASVLSAAKGIEHDTDVRMSEVLGACGWAPRRISALSGPNLAPEIVRRLPAASVVACDDEQEALRWQEALSGGPFRVYRSTDVAGVEVGGAFKNVVAIAAGASAGLGLGVNALSAIVTRGLAEMTRLGVAMGARAETFQGLAGIGDLAATCFSPLSRNRRLGELLAAGKPLSAALEQLGGVAEGAATAPVALDLARRLGVDLPITEQVCAVLAGRSTVPEAMAQLLSRALRPE